MVIETDQLIGTLQYILSTLTVHYLYIVYA